MRASPLRRLVALAALSVPYAVACSSAPVTSVDTDAGVRPAQSMECGSTSSVVVAASCHNYAIEGITHCYDQRQVTFGMNVDACGWGGGALKARCTCPREGLLGGCSRVVHDTLNDEQTQVIDWYYEGEDYGGMTAYDMRLNCEHYQGVWLAPEDPLRFLPLSASGATAPAVLAPASTTSSSEAVPRGLRYELTAPPWLRGGRGPR